MVSCALSNNKLAPKCPISHLNCMYCTRIYIIVPNFTLHFDSKYLYGIYISIFE